MSESVNLFDVSACETEWVQKVIDAADTAKTAETNVQPVLALLYNNAGAHNSIYRGKALGDTVTDAQWAAIKAGTFDDLYIGDYWTINGVNWRIAAFDYYLNCGDTATTDHHVVMVPDVCLYTATMNSTNTIEGGYVGSEMYTTNLEQAKTMVKAAFGGHVLNHRIYLTNAVAGDYATGGAWCDSEVDLMCEQMVCGCKIYSQMPNNTTIPDNQTVEKSALPLFQLELERQVASQYALRDIAYKYGFVTIQKGFVTRWGAKYPVGVRPSFCIY